MDADLAVAGYKTFCVYTIEIFRIWHTCLRNRNVDGSTKETNLEIILLNNIYCDKLINKNVRFNVNPTRCSLNSDAVPTQIFGYRTPRTCQNIWTFSAKDLYLGLYLVNKLELTLLL